MTVLSTDKAPALVKLNTSAAVYVSLLPLPLVSSYVPIFEPELILRTLSVEESKPKLHLADAPSISCMIVEAKDVPPLSLNLKSVWVPAFAEISKILLTPLYITGLVGLPLFENSESVNIVVLDSLVTFSNDILFFKLVLSNLVFLLPMVIVSPTKSLPQLPEFVYFLPSPNLPILSPSPNLNHSSFIFAYIPKPFSVDLNVMSPLSPSTWLG